MAYLRRALPTVDRWERPRDSVFSIEAEYLRTCARTPGCESVHEKEEG